MAFLFELAAQTAHQIQGSALVKRLSSVMLHTLWVGLILADRATYVFPAGVLLQPYKRTQEYINTALHRRGGQTNTTTVANDRFFPLRLTGASCRWMLQHVLVTPHLHLWTDQQGITHNHFFDHGKILQIALLRVFGFGNLNYMEALLSTFNPVLPLDQTQINALYNLMNAWSLNSNVIAMEVYGQLMTKKYHIRIMLTLLSTFANNLVGALYANFDTVAGPLMPFAVALRLFTALRVPTCKADGIIAWLFICDLSEYGYVAPPTLDDLAHHISRDIRKRKPKGPANALKTIAEWEGVVCPTDKAGISTLLTRAWDVITGVVVLNDDGVMAGVVAECAQAQGRMLSVIDLEHVLCKISRQVKKET